MADVNREHKDRLFKFIFGNPDNRTWILSLYNAINNTSYTNASDIDVTTIENAVYMGMKNDVSFLVADTMNMYEQQSTFNPNMPMRFLIYAGMLYDSYIELNSTYHRFSSKQQTAPTPKCVCFYNGLSEKEDKVVLKLRDAFVTDASPDIDVRVTMLNINYGHNKDLMDACDPLYEYAWFVERVRVNQQTQPNLAKAVDAALDEMPDSMVIKSFLLKNRAEVTRMCITEYDEAKTFAEQRDEGLAEGRAEGLAEGRAEGRAEGIDVYNTLLQRLIELGRTGEIERVATDAAYRDSLFEEFGLR